MREHQRIARRDFLRRSAVGALAVGLSAASARRVLGANDRINVGVIGCGGMGTGHLRRLVEMSDNGEANIKVIAVCDIYEPRKQRAKDICKGLLFHDYRDMLALRDLDVVWIATPDHWHATITMDAMEAGKDVYCEKPMTLYWHEAKAVYETALRTRRILQVGAQGTSGPGWDKANELIREGKIGKVLWSQTSSSRNSKGGEWNYGIDQGVSPSNLDWDRFIGPAQWRPFDPERYFRFRKYWDYSGGTATDLFSHYLYALMKALGPELPSSVVSGGGNWVHKDREVPDTFHMLAQYPSGHTVLAVSSMANEQGVSTLIRGQQATMYPGGGGVTIRREPAFLEEGEETGGEIKVSVPHPGDILKAHANNLFECMRTRGKTNCHAELAYKTTVAIALSVASYRENRVKVFDPVREQLVS